MAGANCGATGSGTRINPYCLDWLLGNPFSLDGYGAPPGYSREGPSLGVVRRRVGEWEERRELNWDSYGK